jgi:hypothetical protein
MLIKQSIINDADIKSVFSMRFATRRPIECGFRVKLERSESLYRENHYTIGLLDTTNYICLLDDRTLPVFEQFREKQEMYREKQLRIFSIHFIIRTTINFEFQLVCLKINVLSYPLFSQ